MTCAGATIRIFVASKTIRQDRVKFFFRFLLLIGFCGSMVNLQINGESGYESGGKKFCEAIDRQGSLLPEAV